MFKPISVFVGLRYTRAKRRNHFISFISLMSMFGIALGIIVLITVLSVMNGFDKEIKKRVFSMWPAITITSNQGQIKNWQELENILRELPEITNMAPYVSGEVLLSSGGSVQPALLNGIHPSAEEKISALHQKMLQGQLTNLNPNSFGIVIGEELANRLDVIIGDKITVITPQGSLSPAGYIPRLKRFTVVGIFRAGGGFGFDMALAYINLADAQRLFQMGASISGIHANIKNVYAAPKFSQDLARYLTPSARILNWTNQFGPFFQAIKLEKTMMFVILLLIIVVAVFNLVCTLVMVVNDKESDIAILRTYGATPKMIMSIFIIQGAVVGIIGTILGIIGGIALALNVTQLVDWLGRTLNIQFISSSNYIVDYLPSHLIWQDVVTISLIALFLSLIATLYPAWKASRTEPIEALRYE